MPSINPNIEGFQEKFQILQDVFNKKFQNKDHDIKTQIIKRIINYYDGSQPTRGNLFLIIGDTGSGKTSLIKKIYNELQKLEIKINRTHVVIPTIEYYDVDKLILDTFDKEVLNDKIIKEENPLRKWFEDFLMENNDTQIYCLDHLDLLLSLYKKHNDISSFKNSCLFAERHRYINTPVNEDFKRIYILSLTKKTVIFNEDDPFRNVYEISGFSRDKIQSELEILKIQPPQHRSLNIYNLMKCVGV